MDAKEKLSEYLDEIKTKKVVSIAYIYRDGDEDKASGITTYPQNVRNFLALERIALTPSERNVIDSVIQYALLRQEGVKEVELVKDGKEKT